MIFWLNFNVAKNYLLKKDTFHPDKKSVAVKIMHLDYSRLGAQVYVI